LFCGNPKMGNNNDCVKNVVKHILLDMHDIQIMADDISFSIMKL